MDRKILPTLSRNSTSYLCHYQSSMCWEKSAERYSSECRPSNWRLVETKTNYQHYNTNRIGSSYFEIHHRRTAFRHSREGQTPEDPRQNWPLLLYHQLAGLAYQTSLPGQFPHPSIRFEKPQCTSRDFGFRRCFLHESFKWFRPIHTYRFGFGHCVWMLRLIQCSMWIWTCLTSEPGCHDGLCN